MMDHDDFVEIKLLLEKSCDNCMLTKKHCASCRIDKLRGIVGQFSQRGAYEIVLINVEELKVLLNLAGDAGVSPDHEVVAKWRGIVSEMTIA